MAVVAPTELSKRPCKCYRVPSLSETILVGSDRSSNLKDQYVLGEQLGLGQFGVIRSCTDKITGEVLACKSISKDRLVTSEDVRSIRLEIEIMTRLSGHPNVVDLKAVYEEEDHVHLVMELCAGGELFHKLEKHGRFSEPDARILFRHLMQVVLYCHENGVVHRDLKPENILLATKASSSPIKVADFGLATYIKPGESLRGLVGSPFYIAPEVLAGGYNEAADVWSAGVILYILLSGTPPFWGKTKSKIFDAVKIADLRFPSSPWDRVSEPALDLIRRMLCTDPSQRLTAQQVLDHSWMTRSELQPEQLDRHEAQTCKELGDHCLGSSFSTPFMSRNQDISFGNASAISCDNQSPVFTCRSSFSSSFQGEQFTPFSEYAGFSFRSNGDSIGGTVQSMPSFAFFSSVEKSNRVAEMAKETSLEILLHDSSVCFTENLGSNEKASEFKRSRTSGIHSKRNRTIGLGERDQIDLIVSESIIRWSSCTHFANSCQSSLVF